MNRLMQIGHAYEAFLQSLDQPRSQMSSRTQFWGQVGLLAILLGTIVALRLMTGHWCNVPAA